MIYENLVRYKLRRDNFKAEVNESGIVRYEVSLILEQFGVKNNNNTVESIKAPRNCVI